MTSISLEQSFRRCEGESNFRLFFKKLNLSIFLGQHSEVSQFVFIVYRSQRLPKHIETKVLTICFYFNKAFLKIKKRSAISLPHYVSA